MKFKVLPAGSSCPKTRSDTAYLIEDNWDDWFEFSTMYSVYYVDKRLDAINLGSIKIGQRGMKSGQRRPDIPATFSKLSTEFFSIGQDEDYYTDIFQLGERLNQTILTSLRDMAYEEGLLEKAISERVTKTSLLRSVSQTSIKGQFRRIAYGGARLSQYSFAYEAPVSKNRNESTMRLDFYVEPDSNPPSNVHVLIGRNGVGKTHLINNMVNSIIDPRSPQNKFGRFFSNEFSDEHIFSNAVSVTFSAFDETEPQAEKKDKSKGIQFSYIGLKRIKKSDEKVAPPKSPVMLKNEFIRSISSCKSGSKLERWKTAIRKLETDPVFKDVNIVSLLDFQNDEEFKKEAGFAFKNLSSGHKIVLLTITRLVETIEERSLVFLDEPEAHLHPPLLSAFTRSLSDLLINRNAVAIIATHSPVVLQEVPENCVWKLWRSGRLEKAERLEIESFGENVGILTREVFGLEVTNSGFHSLLKEAAKDSSSYDSALKKFQGNLGMEAKGILKSLLLEKEDNLND